MLVNNLCWIILEFGYLKTTRKDNEDQLYAINDDSVPVKEFKKLDKKLCILAMNKTIKISMHNETEHKQEDSVTKDNSLTMTGKRVEMTGKRVEMTGKRVEMTGKRDKFKFKKKNSLKTTI